MYEIHVEGEPRPLGGKFAVQKFWFGQMELEDVTRKYGLSKDDRRYNAVVKILLKTRRDFRRGFSYFTRESVDRKILEICMKG